MPLTASELPRLVLGKYSDGQGLLFRVTGATTRDWYLKVQFQKKRREYKLGDYPELGLAEARAKAREWRALIKQGIDPRGAADTPTFQEVAEQYISTKLKNSSAKTVQQWQNTLKQYVFPFMGNKRVDSVSRHDIETILLQRLTGGSFWESKHVTADRVRGRIEAVLQRAVNHDHAIKNVAIGIKDDLPKVDHVPRHHASMPYQHVCRFLDFLRGSPRPNPMTALAIEFAILTIARSDEVRGALWAEIEGDEWRLPKERTKQRRPHTVYLSDRALQILEEARRFKAGPLVFWGDGQRKLSDNTLNKALQDHYEECFGSRQATIHGFRATFVTWAEETEAPIPERVVEAMQGHRIEQSKVRAAYNRAKYISQRQKASQMWCDFVMGDA